MIKKIKEETINDSDLTNSFEKEIFNKSFDLTVDYSEIALDLITTSDIFKQIPWVKTLTTFYSITSSLNNRYNIKKNLVFLQEFHLNVIDSKKLEEFKYKLNNNNEYKNEILEITLNLIEKFIDIEKSKILASLLKAHIEGFLTWDDYRTLTFVLTQLNPAGYIFLIKWFNGVKMGMLELMEGQAFIVSCGIGIIFEEQIKITLTGKKLYEFGLKSLKNKYIE